VWRVQEEKRKERENLKEQRRKEAEEAATAQLEEEMAKARSTSDMTLRERRLQLITEAVAKHRQATLDSATALLEDAERAVAAGAGDGAQAGFHKMQLRTVEGGAKHARTLAADAKKLLLELQSAARSAAGAAADAGNPDGGGDEESGAAVPARLERLAAVEEAAEAAEGRLVERVQRAQAQIEAMLKLDLGKASSEEVKAVAEERAAILALVQDLAELGKVEDAMKVRGRDLAAREQRLRASWERAAPRIEEALRKILVKGDACLDSVQAALKSGKVGAAVAELGNAHKAYEKFKAAKGAAQRDKR
jgi:hypothetical protein